MIVFALETLLLIFALLLFSLLASTNTNQAAALFNKKPMPAGTSQLVSANPNEIQLYYFLARLKRSALLAAVGAVSLIACAEVIATFCAGMIQEFRTTLIATAAEFLKSVQEGQQQQQQQQNTAQANVLIQLARTVHVRRIHTSDFGEIVFGDAVKQLFSLRRDKFAADILRFLVVPDFICDAASFGLVALLDRSISASTTFLFSRRSSVTVSLCALLLSPAATATAAASRSVSTS